MASQVVISQKKRFLLYLDRFDKFTTAWEVPFGVSQDGIGEALGILINNVSRTLSSLVTEDLVYSRLAHVQGIVRRRRVYFLTQNGRKEVEELKSKLNETIIPYKTREGTLEESPILRVREMVSRDIHRPVSEFDVAEYLRKRDILFIDEFSRFIEKKISKSKEEEPTPRSLVHLISDMPSVSIFVGRKKELDDLRQWKESPGKPIIVTQGIAGIGKSALTAKFAMEYQDKTNLFWYRFHEWDSPRNLADDLSRFLSECGRKQMISRLRGKKSLDITEFVNLLMDETQGLSALLFFDDMQKANTQMLSFLSLVVERWKNPADLGIVIVSRELGKFYDGRDAHVRKVIREMILSGLDEGQSKELLGPKFAEKWREIHSFTKGHPLFLELLKLSTKLELTHDINSFLEHEVLAGLDVKEKKILEKLSVFRYPVPIPNILEEEMQYSLVASLSKKGLVKETQENFIESHELIKDFIYNRLPSQRSLELHAKAAEYYLEMEKSRGEGGIEALYHLQKAGEEESAVELATDIFHSIVDLGLPEIRNLFSSFRADLLTLENQANLLLLRGDVFTYHEEWYEALENYKECLKIRKEMDVEPKKIAEMHNRIGDVQRKIKKWEETLFSHSTALNMYEKVGDKNGLAKEHLSLGIVYKEMKNYQKAKEHYEKSKTILSELSDKKGLAAVYNNLGMLNMDLGKLGRAKESFELGLKLAFEENETVFQAITLQNLGELSLAKGEPEEAIYNFKRSQDMFIGIGRVKESQELALKIGEVYTEIDEPNQAIKAFLKGLDAGRRLEHEHEKKKRIFGTKAKKSGGGASRITARLHSKIATVYRDMQMWEECFSERALALYFYKELESEGDIGLELLTQAFDFEDSKKFDKAIESLKKGLDLVKKNGDQSGMVALNLNLARIYSKNKDLNSAIKSSKEAITLAEGIRDWVGAQRACEMLVEFLNKKGDEKEKKLYATKLKDIMNRIDET